MKACVLPAPRPDRNQSAGVYRRSQRLSLQTGEVLVRVHACGVCRTDLHVIEGELPALKSPIIPGHQVVGVIERTGSGREALSGRRRASAFRGCIRPTAPANTAAPERKISASTPRSPDTRSMAAMPNTSSRRKRSSIGFRRISPICMPRRCCARASSDSAACALSGIEPGGVLGLYGFGAAAHVAIQVARHWGVKVLAFTRDERHQKLALELGAVWAGSGEAASPGEAQRRDHLRAGGRNGSRGAAKSEERRNGGARRNPHEPDSVDVDDDLLYHERVIRSVANNTRKDGEDFLRVAAEDPGAHRDRRFFRSNEANAALNAFKNDAIRGAAVLTL